MSHWDIECLIGYIRRRKYGQSWSKWQTHGGTVWRSHRMEIAG
jgi:hypothetical protein